MVMTLTNAHMFSSFKADGNVALYIHPVFWKTIILPPLTVKQYADSSVKTQATNYKKFCQKLATMFDYYKYSVDDKVRLISMAIYVRGTYRQTQLFY